MRRIPMVLATMVAGVLLASGVALAAAVSEVEPNDPIAGAQAIAASSFDLTENADITDSTTVPHATVNGTGNDTRDYYKFTVPAGSPARVILDMDHTTPDFTVGTSNPQYDPWIELYDSGGAFLTFNDDGAGDPGSTTDDPLGRDSFIQTALAPGTYYVGVGRFAFQGVLAGATYQLHVSVLNPPPDTTPPDTTITAGPVEGSTVEGGTATFEFTASEESTFECRLDDPLGDFTSCSSPKTYTGLSLGSHTFEVRAKDTAGNVDSIPASRTWEVSPDVTAPTVQSITPPSGATRVSLTNPNITATFSEEMGSFPANSFRLQKVRVQGSRETVLNTVSSSVLHLLHTPNVVRLAPSVTLDKNSYYRVTITTAATDVAGNPLQSGATWRFKTAPR